MSADKDKKRALAEWIYRRRAELEHDRRRRYKDTEFAELIGISQPTFSQHSMGKTLPDAATILLYAKALGPEIYSVLGLVPPELATDERWRRIAEIYLNASEDARRAIAERAQEYETDPKSADERETTNKAPSFRQGALISA